MTNQEADRVYSELIGILADTRLSWVANQVEARTTLGKLEEKKITVFEPDETGESAVVFSPTPRMRKATVTSSVDYSGKEKLGLLLDAVERATTEAASIEDELAKLIAAEFPSELSPNAEATAEFIFKDPSNRQRDIVSNVGHRAELHKVIRRLSPLIDKVRIEINAS